MTMLHVGSVTISYSQGLYIVMALFIQFLLKITTEANTNTCLFFIIMLSAVEQ